jgi:phage-related protein (TIGR01555 family)
MSWWRRKSKKNPEAQQPRQAGAGLFSTHHDLGPIVPPRITDIAAAIAQAVNPPHPKGAAAMDTAIGERYPIKHPLAGVPEAVAGWFLSQTFIGYQFCALLAQHWLVDKACSMPAKDAVRQGYEVDVEFDEDDAEADEEANKKIAHKAIKRLKVVDRDMDIKSVMQEYLHFGRIYGVRVALFVVESTDPEYYKKPFNIDGVKPGTYRGISQVDPQWCIPDLSDANLTDPASMKFYEPSFYTIGTLVVHRSHLSIYVPFPVTDFLKPGYQFGGVSVPQRIYERVYASERTANEAPILAMTKRLTTMALADEAFADTDTLKAVIAEFTMMRDNHGVKVGGLEERIEQHDTSLADLDAVIMTQYQLVAAIAEVPSTKLLGTSPKGFGASGEYEEASYREFLEGLQAKLDFMLRRHHQLAMKSIVAPELGIEPLEVDHQWQSLDSPTAVEWADIELKKAQADQIYATIGAIDGMDIRKKIQGDKESSYFGLADIEDEGELEPEIDPLTGEPIDPAGSIV